MQNKTSDSQNFEKEIMSCNCLLKFLYLSPGSMAVSSSGQLFLLMASVAMANTKNALMWRDGTISCSQIAFHGKLELIVDQAGVFALMDL